MEGAGKHRKPRLVFFQWDHQPNAQASPYLLLHMQQQVKCLATCFDVVVINHDCDYARVCDTYEPDLALFESGYRSHGSRRIKISNTGTNRAIPKLGLHNADPWCDRRAGFFSDMEHWGIDTFFSIATLAPDYMPEAGASLFVWPNFIDPEVIRDYNQHKVIPITLTGQAYGLYPWRQKVFPALQDRYPCLVSPAHAYESRLTSQLLWGEAYARVLNASFIVPTCGTAAGELVRKHFEIPGAGACLVTERASTLEAAGFADMENCVFADHHDVVDRVQHLFAHPDELSRITAAGHALVHTRHTLNHRPQIYQWYSLNRHLRPDEKIVQPDPFQPLMKVRRTTVEERMSKVAAGSDRNLLRQGDALFFLDRVEEAKQCYAAGLAIVSYLPEARLKLAICALRQGEADCAYQQVLALLNVTLQDYGAVDPDPVEWAWFLLASLCSGRIDQARRFQALYPHLSHHELRRTRRVIGLLSGLESIFPDQAERPNRKSIHQSTEMSEVEWSEWLAETLERCGQPALAAVLRETPRVVEAPAGARQRRVSRSDINRRARLYSGLHALLSSRGLIQFRPNVPPSPEFGYVRHLARALIPASQLRWMRTWRGALPRFLHGVR